MSRDRLTTKIAASKDNSRKPVEGRELDGFDYNKSKAKILKKALHNMNVSLGTLISAYKDISMIRGSELTPDGKLGGKGFIMSFKDIKQAVNESVSNLSDVTDTIADELTNPMWGLSTTEKKKVKKEQDQVDDKIEEVEESDPQGEVGEVGEDNSDAPAASEEVVEEITGKSKDEEDLSAEDTEKYRGLLSSSNDKTAGTLSRKIMANLLTGEN